MRWISPITFVPLVRNSYLVVDLFFVLSGYVIALNYLDRLKGQAEVFLFVWLRFWRLYPLHIAMFFVWIGFDLAKLVAAKHIHGLSDLSGDDTLWSAIANLLFLHSFGVTNSLSFNRPSWSIGAEFYTYIVFAAAVVFLRGRILVTSSLLALAALAMLMLTGHRDLLVTFDLGFVRAVMGFFVGVLTFLLASSYNREVSGKTFSGSVALLVAAIWWGGDILDYLIVPASALVVFAAAKLRPGNARRSLTSGPLVWLGKVSYSIYMVHTAVLFVVFQAARFSLRSGFAFDHSDGGRWLTTAPLTGTALTIVTFVVVLALSELTFRYIEAPARNWSREYLRLRPRAA